MSSKTMKHWSSLFTCSHFEDAFIPKLVKVSKREEVLPKNPNWRYPGLLHGGWWSYYYTIRHTLQTVQNQKSWLKFVLFGLSASAGYKNRKQIRVETPGRYKRTRDDLDRVMSPHFFIYGKMRHETQHTDGRGRLCSVRSWKIQFTPPLWKMVSSNF